MEFSHHGLTIQLPDEWLAKAGMNNFRVYTRGYAHDSSAGRGFPIYRYAIGEIAPVYENNGMPVFRDAAATGLSAEERVSSILRRFKANIPIAPVVLVAQDPILGYRYKLIEGAHRLYCSLAVGYSHIPAIVVPS